MTRSVFDPAAAAYDRLRPDYPAALYDAVERLSGVALRGARIVEVGAGTGIATRQLRHRGADVVALDLSLAMLRRQRSPSGCVVARGEQLPIGDRVADLVCSATAWHWVQFDAGVAEAVRVLRPGGTLALWWNKSADRDQTWWQDCWAGVRRRGVQPGGGYARDYETHDVDADLRRTKAFADVARHEARWERSVPIADRLAELRTHSAVLELGGQADDFLAEQRAVLAAAFPDGVVRERYRTHLHVARMPG